MTAEEKAAFTQELLAQAWHRAEPAVRERLDVLDAASQAACDGNLAPELRAPAIAESHKLAGTLGMFGFPRGTDLAREIELLLEASVNPPAEPLRSLTLALRSAVFPGEAAN